MEISKKEKNCFHDSKKQQQNRNRWTNKHIVLYRKWEKTDEKYRVFFLITEIVEISRAFTGVEFSMFSKIQLRVEHSNSKSSCPESSVSSHYPTFHSLEHRVIYKKCNSSETESVSKQKISDLARNAEQWHGVSMIMHFDKYQKISLFHFLQF